jgi:hypothetical protein
LQRLLATAAADAVVLAQERKDWMGVLLGSTSVDGEAGGTVPATLSAPASFGAFTPGAERTYTAATTATVVSSAGDATLRVADPNATATGRLVNGPFPATFPLATTTP